MNNNNIQPEFWNQVINDLSVRSALVRENPLIFFYAYFGHYIKYQTAEFQKEIFGIINAQYEKRVVIEAFRGSAKSTLISLIFPIWAVIGKPQYKLIVILGQTQEQARVYLNNIKREFEENELLKKDLGPFQEVTDEWRNISLVIPKYGAKIMAASTEQAVRGLRFKEHRPDLIILDDLEDVESVKTKENRDKLFSIIMSNIIPMGDLHTRLFFIGTRLHNDALIVRLKKAIESNQMKGLFRSYPLLDKDKNIAWPGKFPNLDAVEELRTSLPDKVAWHQEYLLEVIDDETQVIRQEWIKTYKDLPPMNKILKYRFTVISVDPAFSQKDSADYTGIVTANVYGYDKDTKIYIRREWYNKRFTVDELTNTVKELTELLGEPADVRVVVEEVAAQTMLTDIFEEANIYVDGFKPHSTDKRHRLAVAGKYMQSGQVLFPELGAEPISEQILGYGSERHDDLMDAFSQLVIYVMRELNQSFRIPNIESVSGQPVTQKEQEKKVDLAQSLEDQYARSQFNETMKATLIAYRGY